MNEKISEKDYHREWRLRQAGNCLDCGRKLSTPGARRCRICACLQRNRERKGVNAWHYEEGRYEANGYVFIYKPSHPRTKPGNRYVREHILVWEETHGKLLPKGWLVHHLNGIRNDNRPENLLGMLKKDHPRQTYIKALQAKIRELEVKYYEPREEVTR